MAGGASAGRETKAAINTAFRTAEPTRRATRRFMRLKKL
jgi:hypothetical protein